MKIVKQVDLNLSSYHDILVSFFEAINNTTFIVFSEEPAEP